MNKEKKYIGTAKEFQYGINAQIDITEIINICLLNGTKKENAKIMFAELSKLKDVPGFSQFPTKDQKQKIVIKIQISKRKNTDNYGNTHNVMLNEWVPTPKDNSQIKNDFDNSNDDFPF